MEKIRVRGKNYIVVLAILLIFAISLMTAIKPAKAAYVKFYVYQPLGYIPFATPGVKQAVNITIMVETSGMDDWADPNNGIVGWGVNLQVDPNVLNIDTVAPPPPPPGQLAPAKAEGGKPNFFLYTYASWYGLTSNLLAGSSNPTTGYWANIAETIMPTPTHGAGDYTSANYPKVVTLYVTAKSDTQPCLIDIVSAYYKTPTGVYPVEIIVDGYYGPQPPKAEFTYTPSMPLVDQAVTFNASASYDPDGGTITSYEWDFDYDGTTFDVDATDAVANHTYTMVGTHTVALNVTDDEGLWDTLSKNVTIHALPVASFTYSPSEPSVGDPVTFNASASDDPDGTITAYTWSFGDGLTSTETDPITKHVYTVDADYTVTLNVTDNDGLTNTTTATVTVSRGKRGVLDVEMDVGSIHFPGEIAEFYVLTSFMGEPVDAEKLNATLYYSNGTLHKDLSRSIGRIDKGLYRINYTIPSAAPIGTYVLVANASFSTARGVSLKSFLVSQTLMHQNAAIADITGDIATIILDYLGPIKANLTAINATLVRIEGTTAVINSTLGELETSVDTINAIITEINGTVTTINSTLGSIKVDIGDINGRITEINGTLVKIQTSIGLIEANLTTINAKLAAINGTLAIVKTDLMESINTTIAVELDRINATITEVKDGLLTINSTLGSIQLDLADVKEDISLKLVNVVGDLEEGLANVTAAIIDARGNILLELGQVEVKLGDINATLINIEGNLVTIKTDVGVINGTITSVRGEIATIETDRGVIEVTPTSFTIVAGVLGEWTGVTTGQVTTQAGKFDVMVLTNSTLESPVTFSDNTLTVVVSGEGGTAGVLNVKIPKRLLVGLGSHVDEFAVTIDGKLVSFTYVEEAETYSVKIVYTHSTHTIKIHLAGAHTPFWILLAAALAIAATVVVTTLSILWMRRKPINRKDKI